MKTIFILLLLCSLCLGGQFTEIRTLKGDTFKNAEIKIIDDDFCRILHDSGVAKVKWINLPDNIREEFGMTEEKRLKKEKEKKADEEAKAEYHKKRAAELAEIVFQIKKENELRDFAGFISILEKIIESGEQFQDLPDFEWLSQVRKVAIVLLGHPDSVFQEKEFDWNLKIWNPITEKREKLTMSSSGPHTVFESESGKIKTFILGK